MPAVTSDSGRVMAAYGRTVARVGGIYTLGVVGAVPFGIVALAITTRYLEPADYGRLALLMALSAFITVIAGLFVAQGTLMAVYRVGDDADGDGDVVVTSLEPTGELPEISAQEKKALLGTGMLLIALNATVLCGLVAAAAAPFASVILGDDRWADAVRWMALAAWTGAIWRLVHQVWRMERRAVAWVGFQLLRPFLMVAGTWYGLEAGLGLEAPLIAAAAATAVSIVVSLSLSTSCIRLAPRRDHVGTIYAAGSRFVPVVIAGQIQQNGAIFLLAALAGPATVGIFQAARRIAQIPSYFADGFLMGWAPLEHSPISTAVKDRRGQQEKAAGTFFLLCLGLLGLLVLVSLGSDVLVGIAAAEYASAANLIPLLAVAAAAASIFQGLYRASRFPNRQRWYAGLHLAWVVPYVAVAVAVLEIGASYAVAVAAIVAGALVSIAMVTLDRRGGDPTPYPWGRLGIAFAFAIVAIAAGKLIPVPEGMRLALAVLILLAFPVALVLLGVVERRQLGTVATVISGLFPTWTSTASLRRRLASLAPAEGRALVLVAWERRSVAAAAAEIGATDSVVLARFTRALRRFEGYDGSATPHDDQIARYLLFAGPTLERDMIGEQLQGRGVDPYDLHEVDLAMRRVQRLRRRGLRVEARRVLGDGREHRVDAVREGRGRLLAGRR